MNTISPLQMETKNDESLAGRFLRIREVSRQLCEHLQPEDCVVQTMADVSPTKWHLAHTTWFFEHFILEPFLEGYRRHNDRYHFLFNSYYQSAGEMHKRPQRGLLSRPTLKEVFDYREQVDEGMIRLLHKGRTSEEVRDRLVLGLNHEQQHQELLLTDIKHVFSCNPLEPIVHPSLRAPPANSPDPHRFLPGPSGIFAVGAEGSGFCFDNELPAHTELIREHSIGSRLITNGEFLEFIRDRGYEQSTLWLSDGWAAVNERNWKRPLYWSEDCDSEFTLGGRRPLDPDAPVCHVSLYEADAFARWSGARLPTEFEWELAAAESPVSGNLLESGYWHPVAAEGGAHQLFGDVWEWTSSAYAPYPGFQPLNGSLGEYNGKFMCNQVTVRGGSCVSAREHIRASYRSFFYPDARWQFLGIRLARDGS